MMPQPPSLSSNSLIGTSLDSGLKAEMQACRSLTLQLFETIDAQTFRQQAHPDFSPVGWHLGHIGYTEAKWVLHHMAHLPLPWPQYQRLFAADGLPKRERQNLPEYAAIVDYLQIIRSQVFDYLQQTSISTEERLWQFLLQHESQHCETVAIVLAMLGHLSPYQHFASAISQPTLSDTAQQIPAGGFWMGQQDTAALDNEQPQHWVEVEAFYLDRCPVSSAAYRQFIEAGGYQDSRWWSIEGWQWRQQQAITQPFYWPAQDSWDALPVCGVSWYEAQAYAQFVGKRLPTEKEWEKAMQLYPDLRQSQVWEWTDSWFEGYPGFHWFPYPGYSQTYFDRQHRVLRGGSWASSRWTSRPSFRNWYHPWTRVIFSGFRLCAE